MKNRAKKIDTKILKFVIQALLAHLDRRKRLYDANIRYNIHVALLFFA